MKMIIGEHHEAIHHQIKEFERTRGFYHCKHPAHSCVVGCKERGGLTYGDSLNSSGNDNNAFVSFLNTV